jgi:hypothetical protein
MRRLGRLTPCWFHGPAAPPQQRHATQSPSLLRPLAPAIGAPLATYPALGTGQTGRWMRCSGRSASIWLAAMRSMSTRQVPSRSHNLSATAATGAAATTRSISSPLSTSPWARPVPERRDMCLEQQRESRPLVHGQLEYVWPFPADELVEMSSPFDPTEQRIGSEDMHLAHWAQADGAKAIDSTWLSMTEAPSELPCFDPQRACLRSGAGRRRARVSLVDGLFAAVGYVGGVLVAAGLVMILMAWGGMDERMPTQIPPRRLARYPIAAGALLLVVAAVGLIFPGG